MSLLFLVISDITVIRNGGQRVVVMVTTTLRKVELTHALINLCPVSTDGTSPVPSIYIDKVICTSSNNMLTTAIRAISSIVMGISTSRPVPEFWS
jgi:S-adenosylmethionine:tRNA-ribosyltransferase-isomerase (queuine synthetase)